MWNMPHLNHKSNYKCLMHQFHTLGQGRGCEDVRKIKQKMENNGEKNEILVPRWLNQAVLRSPTLDSLYPNHSSEQRGLGSWEVFEVEFGPGKM